MDTNIAQAQVKLSRRQRRKLRQQQSTLSPTALPVPAVITAQTQALDALADSAQRAKRDLESKQPRYKKTSSDIFFNAILQFVRAMDLEAPNTSDPRALDMWYRDFAFRESHLTGVLNSVVAIDKNRGWTLTGGRNQVNRYTSILHNVDAGQGWRHFISLQAQSYYTTRMGFVAECGLESDADNAPLRTLWSVDPTRVRLTGNTEYPLRYFPRVGDNHSVQDWLPRDFIRGCSMPSTDETQFDYGWPAVARCIDLARIMVAVYQHDNEQLGARAPRGLLLLNGISQQQWDTAMQARDETLNGLEREYFGGVAVIASSGVDEISAALTGLSQLPKDFDTEKFTSLLMYAYALSFGYDPREFWPVSGGQLGTATETETQHRKSTSKGDTDFVLIMQEKLQSRLPETIEFSFEQRDVEGEQADVALQLQKSQVITEMTKWVVSNQSVLTVAQILQLAVQAKIIPEDWTPEDEDVTTTDTDTAQVLQSRSVQLAKERFPTQDVVQYNSKRKTLKTLVRAGLQSRVFPASSVIERATISSITRRFQADLRRLATLGFISDESILGDVRRLVKDAIADAYIAGLAEGHIAPEDMDTDDAMMVVELATTQAEFVTDFVRAIRAAKKDRAAQREILDTRIPYWAANIEAAGRAGINSAKKNEMVEFRIKPGADPSEESCKTCKQLLGKKHRRKWVQQYGLDPAPGNENFECKCFNCPHGWLPVEA